MDLNQVAYFLNLAETLNFTEAARVSGVSQPSLTRAIQRLEDELGGPVVYRDGKDTRLTALGRDLVVEFMRVQSALAAVHELAENSVVGRRSRIGIGVATTLAPRSFSRFWAHVLKELPDVELQFHPLLPGETEARTHGWEIKEELDHVVDIVIEAGEVIAEPTTVIDWSEDGPEVVRYGSGDAARFEG